ncbi:MAG: hypothetical protein COX41_02085, partial [Candidatus Omnitrophica bacterium CG23_combo_of_CG06-09_8_20_14_all_41_10]
LKQSHKNDDLMDKGYHRFEHSLEVADLAFTTAVMKKYPYQAALEMFVAGLLHDYDPRQAYQAPKVVNTIYKLGDTSQIVKIVEGLGLDMGRIILFIRGTDFPMKEEQLEYIGKSISGISNENIRKRTEEQLNLLGLIDKSATYIHLRITPQESELRVRELAKEIGIKEEDMLKGTPEFFKNFVQNDISKLTSVLGKNYENKWQSIEQHFRDVSGFLKENA